MIIPFGKSNKYQSDMNFAKEVLFNEFLEKKACSSSKMKKKKTKESKPLKKDEACGFTSASGEACEGKEKCIKLKLRKKKETGNAKKLPMKEGDDSVVESANKSKFVSLALLKDEERDLIIEYWTYGGFPEEFAKALAKEY